MQTRAHVWILPAFACLCAAAGGVAAGWFLRGAPVPAQVPAPHSAEPVTRAQFEELKRELLERLGEAAHAPRGTGAAPAPASPPEGGALLDLARRFDELDARVAVLATGVRPGIGGRAWSNARGPGSESIEKMIARVQEQARRDNTGERGEDAIPTILREHSLWTVEDVARAYGPPLRADGNDGLAFRYGRFALENYGGEYSLYFRFREGFVTDFGFDSIGDG